MCEYPKHCFLEYRIFFALIKTQSKTKSKSKNNHFQKYI